MHMFTIEMLPNLCRHCAKHHLDTQQHQQSREHLDSTNFHKSIWLLLTIARKKLNQIRDLSHNENEQNENRNATNENTLNLLNVMAHHNNDQSLQCNNKSLVTQTQSIHGEESVQNGGSSVFVAESRKMNILTNDDVGTSFSNGALVDVRTPQTVRNIDMQQKQEQQVTLSLDETTAMKRSHCLPSSSTLRPCIHCRCAGAHSSSDKNAQQTQNPEPKHSVQKNSNLNLNVHEKTRENPNSLSQQTNHTDRLANSSDLDRCIVYGIDPYGSSRSVRTFCANYSNNHPRKNAYVNHRWPYAISSTMNFSHVLLICVAFMVFGVRNAVIMADDTPANTNLSMTENGICSSKDIRNSVKNFNELKGCRVIEGFLMITLIDKYNETDYDGLEFPLLTEVTEFLLVYRVNGLKSLGKLFPNLRIIRGNVLIHDFSFIIFEMMHLQEIGLTSLIKIPRGSVRIEKNPALCFVDTIDWSLITSGSKENMFSNNKAVNECPTCPGGNKNDNNNGELSKSNADAIVCPEAAGRRLCWNHQQCQIICPAKCGNLTCNENGQCCDESCLGCSNENPNVCLSCRYLSFGNVSNRQCVQNCPANTFAHENRRCVTEDECRAIKKPVFVKYDFNLLDYPYIPRHDGKCATDCPSNFYPDGPSGKRECIPCKGSCKKECPPGNIDSISTAQRYRGCTHIKGPFVINIRNQGGHNIVRELETFLSDIEVIEGPLSIVRSYPLLSLGFFKKLRIVEGDTTGKEKYGFKVLENQNLQALFTQNVTIQHGRMFFHFNPKLCMNIIEGFKDNVLDLRNVSKLPADEVAPNSNGDKTACNVTSLEVEIKTFSHNVVVMELKPLPYEDERQLLGYLLYYMPAPYQNVTMFDGRDACGGDGWQVDDVPDNNRNSTPVSIIATHLKPYTQYAYFIRTYTVASEQRGGITPIKYFRTAPYKPESVTKLSVAPNGSSEIIVKWGPPVHAHGNLTKYIVKSSMVPDDPQLLDLRNYCNEPLGIEAKIPTSIKPNEVKEKEKQDTTLDSGCSCDSEDGREKTKFSDEDAEQLIEFEDELHNTVYVRQENLRRRRDVSAQMYMSDGTTYTMIKTRHRRSSNSTVNQPEIFPIQPNVKPETKPATDDKVDKMDPTNTYYTYVYREVNASVFTLTLSQLKHYSYYSITVKACREGTGDNCGNEMIAYQRTGKIEAADDVTYVAVEKLPVSNHSTGVRLSWNEPENPNGMIVSYNIRYGRVDIEHAKYQDICITQNLYREQGRSHIITDLVNGNYSFTVVANSLAGSNTRWSKPVYHNVDEPTLSPTIIVIIVFSVILVLCGIGALAWFYRRKYGPPDSRIKIIASVNPEYVSMQYTPDEWEIPREKIIQLNELGQGSFGMVYEGVVLNLDRDHDRIRCAIKTVNENATDRERINFLKEAAVMKAFDTHHVVRLLGVVSRGQPVLVIMELMVNGDLKGFLRSHRPETGNDVQPPTLRQILQMSIEIADGMAYLAAKKFVHRDLAARNCMVAEDLTVKIGDFGMTRDIYETDYYRKGTKGLLPVRWMAPESLKDGVFSSSSDVFSFGIVLWEMATLASQPYQGLSNDQVLRYVIDGGVMERPENCPERIYTLMCRCWQHRPSARPTFMQIVSMLLDEAKPNFRQVSFYHSQPGQELLQLPQHQLMEVVDVRTPLRAEEENFSVGADDDDDPEDPNSFLMSEKRNISHQSASASGPSNSPLR